jgi:hypothetical protein
MQGRPSGLLLAELSPPTVANEKGEALSNRSCDVTPGAFENADELTQSYSNVRRFVHAEVSMQELPDADMTFGITAATGALQLSHQVHLKSTFFISAAHENLVACYKILVRLQKWTLECVY